MAICKYCGKKAGLFSHFHKECEEKNKQGIVILEGSIKSFFRNAISIQELCNVKNSVINKYCVLYEDVSLASAKCIDEWTNNIHWPFKPSHLNKIKEFLTNIGVSYNSINNEGALDRLCQKMLKGFMAEFFTDKKSMQRAVEISQKVKNTLPLARDKEEQAYYDMLAKAGKKFIVDGVISQTNQQKIDEYVSFLGLSLTNLPYSLKGYAIEELGQASILSDLQAGRTPKYVINTPVILSKGEIALWCYNNVTMYQEKIKREYVGRSSGFSFPIVKGLRYRTGGFKGHPVESSYMDNMGAGSLIITNKNIIFWGQTRSIKVPYKKIIGINPYSDGMEVQRDGSNVKRLTFQGFDCSFVMNVLSIIQ